MAGSYEELRVVGTTTSSGSTTTSSIWLAKVVYTAVTIAYEFSGREIFLKKENTFKKGGGLRGEQRAPLIYPS